MTKTIWLSPLSRWSKLCSLACQRQHPCLDPHQYAFKSSRSAENVISTALHSVFTLLMDTIFWTESQHFNLKAAQDDQHQAMSLPTIMWNMMVVTSSCNYRNNRGCNIFIQQSASITYKVWMSREVNSGRSLWCSRCLSLLMRHVHPSCMHVRTHCDVCRHICSVYAWMS